MARCLSSVCDFEPCVIHLLTINWSIDSVNQLFIHSITIHEFIFLTIFFFFNCCLQYVLASISCSCCPNINAFRHQCNKTYNSHLGPFDPKFSVHLLNHHQGFSITKFNELPLNRYRIMALRMWEPNLIQLDLHVSQVGPNFTTFNFKF